RAFILLRDFVFSNGAGLSMGELRDKIFVKMNEYDLYRKKHGFNAIKSAVEVLLSSQSLIKAAGSGVLGALAGHFLGIADPISAASILTGTAIVFDCGKATIASKSALIEGEVSAKTNPA